MEAGVNWKLAFPGVERLARMQLLNMLLQRQNVRAMLRSGAYGDQARQAHLERRFEEADRDVKAAILLACLAHVNVSDILEAGSDSDKDTLRRLQQGD